jgi:hypothetical protein
MQGFPRNLGDPVVSHQKKSRRGGTGRSTPRLWGAARSIPGERKDTVPRRVPESIRRTKRTGKGGRKSEHPRSTEEAGEPTRRDPVEGRGMSGHGTVGGKGNRHVEV